MSHHLIPITPGAGQPEKVYIHKLQHNFKTHIYMSSFKKDAISPTFSVHP